MGVGGKGFGARTTAGEVVRVFCERIRGRNVLITGVSPNSIGSALALAISSQAPNLLILVSRTLANLKLVEQEIKDNFPGIGVRVVVVDFADLANVRRGAKAVEGVLGGERGGIDVLFNNAGINISERKDTVDGLEAQWGTNHIGPFLFTNLLLPLLTAPSSCSSQKRIIMTSSDAHRISPIRFSDYNQEPGKKVGRDEEPRRGLPEGMIRGDGGYEPSVAYGQSKTANVLFAVGLNRRLTGRKEGEVRSFAVMPGTIMTGIIRGLSEQDYKALTAVTPEWKSLDEGAATLVVAGFDPGLNDEQGVYLEDCQMKRSSKWASDSEKAERLWKLSEELVGERFRAGKGSSRL